MKTPALVLIASLMALTAPVAQAQQQMPDRGEMMNRFDRMDHLMDEAAKAHGPARRQQVHQHMQMMHEMMEQMHGMMGGGMGTTRPGGQMGPGGQGPGGMAQRGPGSQMSPGLNEQMQHMQNRMDMMQRMMEQMQKQHELMLKDDDEKEKG